MTGCDPIHPDVRAAVQGDHRLYLDYPELQTDECILLAYRGSIAHGTYEPNHEPNSIDDIDLIGISVPPLDHYFGLREFGSRGTKEIKRGDLDIVLYEARKTISLLAKGNPNVLSLLWLPDDLYVHVEPAARRLIDNRHLFATKAVYKPFRGYAQGQLRKMTSGSFNGYMGAKRKRLVERHGFDCKNASHLIRILRQGIEFLSTGQMEVYRSDAEELLAIKHGEWSLDGVRFAAEAADEKLEAAVKASPLPDAPDWDAINRLAEDVVGDALGVRP